ncbi:hypothetical protein M8C21_025689 [Ambrosia artemisiifolia]|uniref:Glycoside hydrolase family 3 N-terminal domain-containing protein n=1 Tax=Ambrosia artemisiifolia TaxID=4212 RepID=A0AAD5C0L7_AMBAR|nr:hypothetical protein M8C21_025689 [Ambrosia artemisiifolia]
MTTTHFTFSQTFVMILGPGSAVVRDTDLVKRICAATATEVRGTGIQYAFAPCIAVCRDPRWGWCYKSYGADTKLVESMTDIILGLQGEILEGSRPGVPHVAGKNKVAACAKHFVADGGTTHGIDENNTVSNEQEVYYSQFHTRINCAPYSLPVGFVGINFRNEDEAAPALSSGSNSSAEEKKIN